MLSYVCPLFFFFNDTAPTEIYTLPLHDALPISSCISSHSESENTTRRSPLASLISLPPPSRYGDRKSTRLNSSHANISYAVFCLKKKKKKKTPTKIVTNIIHKYYTQYIASLKQY